MARGDAFRNYVSPSRPMPGQLGFRGIAPDVPKVGSLGALFADEPVLMDKMGAGDRRAVKMSVSQLAGQWMKYFECSGPTMAQLLREIADLFDEGKAHDKL